MALEEGFTILMRFLRFSQYPCTRVQSQPIYIGRDKDLTTVLTNRAALDTRESEATLSGTIRA